MEYIDLRSDTTTDPTEQMRQSILTSQYGDHSYGEDQTTQKLQQYAADLMGKQAGSFVPSGTFGNQCSLMAAGNPGEEVILPDFCHIITYENGSIGKLSRMVARTLPTKDGLLEVETFKANIRKVKDLQAPKSSVFALENPNSGGLIYPIEDYFELINIAKKAGLHVHMDGGRIFYACSQYGIEAKQLVKDCDSVMFCLSKGLCAPIGSMVVGSHKFIERFRKFRKMLGGNFRKPGILAGPAMIALDKMRHVVPTDIAMARLLGKQLSALGWCKLVNRIDINMVFFVITDERVNATELSQFLIKNKIKNLVGLFQINRFMTHYYIREEQINKIIRVLKQYYSRLLPLNKEQEVI